MYNKVLLIGTVCATPEYKMDSRTGDSLSIKLKINRSDIGKVEIITVSIFDENLLTKAFTDIKENDYLSIQGRIITTNYNKISTIVCPHCQNTDYKESKAEKTEVEVLHYTVVEKGDAEYNMDMNKVFLIGNVCSQLNYRPGSNNGKDYVKYKLAVNRTIHKQTKKGADYPFVVSFNQDATTAANCLKKSNRVFVEGAIQEREIYQKNPYLCNECGYESSPKSKSIVREIITNHVVYIDEKERVE